MTEDDKPVVPPPPPRAARRGIFAPVPGASVEMIEEQTPAPAMTPPVMRKADIPSDNMAKPNSGLQDLNFKVDPDFHRAFKTTATIKGMAMKELLEASFRSWVEQYGDDTLKTLLSRL